MHHSGAYLEFGHFKRPRRESSVGNCCAPPAPPRSGAARATVGVIRGPDPGRTAAGSCGATSADADSLRPESLRTLLNLPIKAHSRRLSPAPVAGRPSFDSTVALVPPQGG